MLWMLSWAGLAFAGGTTVEVVEAGSGQAAVLAFEGIEGLQVRKTYRYVMGRRQFTVDGQDMVAGIDKLALASANAIGSKAGVKPMTELPKDRAHVFAVDYTTTKTGKDWAQRSLQILPCPENAHIFAGVRAGLASADLPTATQKVASNGELASNKRTGSLAIVNPAFAEFDKWALLLPEEPVGVGAVWSYESKRTGAYGVPLLQTTTARLTRREESFVTIELTIANEATKRKVTTSEGVVEVRGLADNHNVQLSCDLRDPTLCTFDRQSASSVSLFVKPLDKPKMTVEQSGTDTLQVGIQLIDPGAAAP